MVKRLAAIAGVAALLLVAAARPQNASAQAAAPLARAGQSTPAAAAGPAPRALLDRYCVGCHNQRAKEAGQEPARKLTLDNLAVTRVGDHADVWERVVRKMRAGMMPPAGTRRPDKAAYDGFITWLEAELDKNAVSYAPPPGLHRLNRTEYANIVHDILELDVDSAIYMQPTYQIHGF